jgi:predicted DNA-binding protein
MAKVHLSLRLEESELEILRTYVKQTGRTQSDVLREFVRSLKDKLKD